MLKNSLKLNRLGKEKYFLIFAKKGLTDMLRNWYAVTDRQTKSALFHVQSNRNCKSIGTIISIFRYGVFFVVMNGELCKIRGETIEK